MPNTKNKATEILFRVFAKCIPSFMPLICEGGDNEEKEEMEDAEMDGTV